MACFTVNSFNSVSFQFEIYIFSTGRKLVEIKFLYMLM